MASGTTASTGRELAGNTRLYYRHVREGHLGYLVQQDGRDFIQYDRVGEPVLRVFKAQDWIAEHEPRPISEVAVARIAYEADMELCRALGEAPTARKPWLSLKDDERIAFMHDGPPTSTRQGLYLVIKAYMRSVGAHG